MTAARRGGALLGAIFAVAWPVLGRAGLPYPSASSEIYDPATGTWAPTGPLLSENDAVHDAVGLPSGKVLINSYGVVGSSWWKGSEVFDPSAGSWRATSPPPLLVDVVGVLPSGRVLAMASVVEHEKSALIYDPATEQWITTAPPPLVVGPGLTVLASGSVRVVGSTTGSDLDPLSAATYDELTDTWSSPTPLTTCVARARFTPLANGRLLAIGRAPSYPTAFSAPSAAVYDPDTGSCSMTGSLLIGEGGGLTPGTLTSLDDGGVLVAGGTSSYPTSAVPTSFAQTYDLASGTWSALPRMASPRSSHTATVLPSGRVLVAGGSVPGFYLEPRPSSTATAELYDAPSRSWVVTGTMTAGRYGHSATRLPDGRVLVAGGYQEVLLVSPTTATVVPGDDLAFAGRGGIGVYVNTAPPSSRPNYVEQPAYSWTLVANGSGGRIDANTGAYVAGCTTPATDVIQLSDAGGHVVTASVTVTGAPVASCLPEPTPPGSPPSDTTSNPVASPSKGGCATGEGIGLASLASLVLSRLSRRRVAPAAREQKTERATGT